MSQERISAKEEMDNFANKPENWRTVIFHGANEGESLSYVELLARQEMKEKKRKQQALKSKEAKGKYSKERVL